MVSIPPPRSSSTRCSADTRKDDQGRIAVSFPRWSLPQDRRCNPQSIALMLGMRVLMHLRGRHRARGDNAGVPAESVQSQRERIGEISCAGSSSEFAIGSATVMIEWVDCLAHLHRRTWSILRHNAVGRNERRRRMEIRADDNESYLLLNLLERQVDRFPSASLDLEVAAHGFRGRCEENWFEATDIARFLSELQQLEHSRSGSAVLKSMGPSRSSLTFSSVDRQGHILLVTSLNKIKYLNSRPFENRLTVGFVVESSLFSGIVSEFKALLQG